MPGQKVAVVVGGGKGFGRAIALTLAANEVRVLVAGRNEAALGDVVGEIASGGGIARHRAGDWHDARTIEGALDRAVEVFHRIDAVIVAAQRGHGQWLRDLFRIASPRLAVPSCVVAVAPCPSNLPAIEIGKTIRELAEEGARSQIACFLLCPWTKDPCERPASPEDVGRAALRIVRGHASNDPEGCVFA